MWSCWSLPVGATGSQPLGTSIRMRKRASESSRDWLDEGERSLLQTDN